MATLSASGNGTSSPRRHRYNRSSTTSVSQLLSDGYSSIMNRLTRRGPSEKSDPIADSKLTAARSRYDDKPLTNKNSTLAGVRRYENNRHISPYSSFSASSNRNLNDDKTYSYLAGPKSRYDASPLRSTSGVNILSRSDSFRRAHMKNNKSPPFTKRYPLKEANNNIDTTFLLGSTRSRLEDKYSSVLDRIAVQKKERARKEREDRDKTLEPEIPVSRGGLMRSFTTAVFGENSFKRTHCSQEKGRDKTPFRNTTDRRVSMTNKQNDKVAHANGFDSTKERTVFGKDRDSIYRRHQRRSLRAEKSEANEKKNGKMCIRAIDINVPGVRDLVSPMQQAGNTTKNSSSASSSTTDLIGQKQIYFPSSDEDDDKTPVGDPLLMERETRRKEIQSLIMKYAHLDEMYGRMGEKETNGVTNEIKKVAEPLSVGDLVALPPELRSRQRAQRPRHLLRRANTPPVRSLANRLPLCAAVCRSNHTRSVAHVYVPFYHYTNP